MRSSQTRQQTIVIGVGSDKEPHNLVIGASDANGLIRIRHANRPKRKRCVQPLELQAWMPRIRLKPAIRRTSPLLNVVRQFREITAKRGMEP